MPGNRGNSLLKVETLHHACTGLFQNRLHMQPYSTAEFRVWPHKRNVTLLGVLVSNIIDIYKEGEEKWGNRCFQEQIFWTSGVGSTTPEW